MPPFKISDLVTFSDRLMVGMGTARFGGLFNPANNTFRNDAHNGGLKEGLFLVLEVGSKESLFQSRWENNVLFARVPRKYFYMRLLKVNTNEIVEYQTIEDPTKDFQVVE